MRLRVAQFGTGPDIVFDCDCVKRYSLRTTPIDCLYSHAPSRGRRWGEWAAGEWGVRERNSAGLREGSACDVRPHERRHRVQDLAGSGQYVRPGDDLQVAHWGSTKFGAFARLMMCIHRSYIAWACVSVFSILHQSFLAVACSGGENWW